MDGSRVVFLNGSAQPGGGEIALAELVVSVPGAKVVLFEDGPVAGMLRGRGAEVEILPASRRLLGNSKESGMPGPGLLADSIRHILSTSRRLRGFDVVHCNNQKAWVVGAFASAIARRPVVWHLHDILTTDHFSRSKIRLVVALSRWRRAKVVANSLATARAFVEAGGLPDRVEVLHNPVDPGRFRDARPVAGLRASLGCEDQPLWAIFSRLASWKGQHVAIEALSMVPRGHLALVGAPLFGEEPWEERLRGMVREKGLDDRVHFLGFRRDIPDLLATVDGAIHASTAPEPFGLVILEAQLAGVPVVASAAGGAMEIVHPGEDGWLFPPGDANALAEILSSWASDRDSARELGRRASHLASEAFDAVRLRRRFAAILDEEARRP